MLIQCGTSTTYTHTHIKGIKFIFKRLGAIVVFYVLFKVFSLLANPMDIDMLGPPTLQLPRCLQA